jgi:hypothetical protein
MIEFVRHRRRLCLVLGLHVSTNGLIDLRALKAQMSKLPVPPLQLALTQSPFK